MRVITRRPSRAVAIATAAAIVLLAMLPRVAGAIYVPGQGSGIEQAIRDYALALAAAEPSRLPAPIQHGGPSLNPASPCLLDRAEPPARLATAWDQAIGYLDGAQAITLALSPWELVSGRSSRADAPRSWRTLQRMAVSLTVGGPTQRLESMRDARVLDVGDHATAEIKLPMVGRRDAGDPAARFPPIPPSGNLTAGARDLMGSEEYRARSGPDADEALRYQAFAAALRAHPSRARALLAERGDLMASVRALRERAERSFLLALSVAADMYGTGFGRDLYAATLIGELARPLPLTVNAGARAGEKVGTTRDWECKLGLGTGHRWLPSRGPLGPIDLNVAGSALLRDHERPTLWLGSLKLDAAMGRALTLTTAVIASDRPERAGVGAFRGSVGVSYRIAGAASP